MEPVIQVGIPRLFDDRDVDSVKAILTCARAFEDLTLQGLPWLVSVCVEERR